MAFTDSSPNPDAGFIGVGRVYWKGSADTVWRDMGETPKFDFTPTVASIDWNSHRAGVKTRIKSIVTEQTGSIAITPQEGTSANWALALMAGTPAAAVSVSGTAEFTTSSGSTALTAITYGSATLVAGRRYSISGAGVPANDTFVFAGGATGSGTGTLDKAATSGGTESAGLIASLGTKSGIIFAESQINGSLMFVGTNAVGRPIIAEFPNVAIKPSGAIGFIQDAALGDLPLTAEVFVDSHLNFGYFEFDGDPTYAPTLA